MNPFFVIFSAILYALSFPILSWWWFSFIALIPFFLALGRADALWQRIWTGLLWSATMTAASGYWLFIPLVSHYGVAIHTAILFLVLFVLVPVCGLFLFFSSAFHFLYRRSLVFNALVIPSLWILFIDFSKTRLPFMVPWGDIGYAAIPFTPFVQVADIGGVYAVSFLILMINGLCCYLIGMLFPVMVWGKTEQPETGLNSRNRLILFTTAVLVVALFFPVLYGGYRISETDAVISRAAGREGIAAVIVQGNYSLSDQWSGMGFENRLKKYLELSQVSARGDKRVIVWPETVLNTPARMHDQFFMELMRWIGSRSLLVAGGIYEDDHSPGFTYNSAYFISGAGRLSRYDKQILLPYAEAVPPVDLLGRYYTAPDHFDRGRTPTCIQTSLGRIGTSICLEILYPRLVRNGVKEGGEILVNISNDAWFGRSAMPYLHLVAARMRAIENRRFLLRAANSGFSALIGPDGRILGKTGLFEQERIIGRFLNIEQQTFYTRYGEWIIFMAAFVIGIFALKRILD